MKLASSRPRLSMGPPLDAAGATGRAARFGASLKA